MAELDLIPHDAASIATNTMNALEAASGRQLYPGDPLRIIGLAFSYLQTVLASATNTAVNQNFLDNATKTNLEALGALFGVSRLEAEAALTTLRFSLGTARSEVTLVPVGTRATVSGSGIYFATEAAAEIPAGQTSVDVSAAASVAGSTGNGFLAGEITTLVDVVPYITAFTNTTASTGGSEVEDDDSLRERIREAPTRFSVAGPEDAYIALTKSAWTSIESVAI
jgi:phage-related baseplate assembly protein